MNPWALCNNISISRVCEAFYDNMVIAVLHEGADCARASRAVLPLEISGQQDFWTTTKEGTTSEVCSRASAPLVRAPTPSSLQRATRAHLTCSPCAQAS